MMLNVKKKRILKTGESDNGSSQKYHSIWGILLLSFIIRGSLPIIAFIVNRDYSVFHVIDTDRYIKTAIELVSSGTFSLNGIPEVVRTPGYPVLLIPGILSGNLEAVTIFIQIILSCLTTYFVYRIALLLFDNIKVATLSALLYAIEPLSIVFSCCLVTETLFTFLNTLFLYYMVQYFKKKSLGSLIFSAVILAVSVYVRPINYFLPILTVAILSIWIITRVRDNRMLVIHATSFFLVAMGLIGLWQVRNKIETGYAGFSAISDHNLYFYEGASVLSVRQGIPLNAVQENMGIGSDEMYYRIHPEQRSWDLPKRYKYMHREGMKIISGDLYTYLKIRAKGTVGVLLGTGAKHWLWLFKYPHSIDARENPIKVFLELMKKEPLQVISRLILGIVLAFYLFLGAAGFFSRDYMCGISTIILFCVGVYLLLIAGGGGAASRFRHPIMPIVSIFAGYGLSIFINKLKPIMRLKNSYA